MKREIKEIYEENISELLIWVEKDVKDVKINKIMP